MSALHRHAEDDRSVAIALGRPAPQSPAQVLQDAADLIRILTGHPNPKESTS